MSTDAPKLTEWVNDIVIIQQMSQFFSPNGSRTLEKPFCPFAFYVYCCPCLDLSPDSKNRKKYGNYINISYKLNYVLDI